MLFCSPQFCAFFLIVFSLYWLTRWHRARVYLLLVASVYFYAKWNHWLAVILCASTFIDYWLARGMDAIESPKWRKSLVFISVVGNVGLLCYFKYVNFFLRSLELALSSAGYQAALPTLQVILPVGISFYTFEAINYTVDVYCGRIRAERNLANLMLFILFFPHLVAGPIVRARDFLPLVARRKHWSWLRANIGVRLILMGLFKKLAIADRMALYVDPVFVDPTTFGTLAFWLASAAYILQVYCDFSGYTDMALGFAHLLGYHLAQNFNMPFIAVNIADFWRRWHISLSTWIRDYLYIPLGGSQGSRWQTSRNLLLTMTLCGLWHGANWNYVAWGFINGVFLLVHASFRKWCKTRQHFVNALESPLGTALRMALTFASVCVGIAVFRTASLSEAGMTLARMFHPVAGATLTYLPHGLWITFTIVVLCHLLAYRDRWHRLWQVTPIPIRGVAFGVGMTMAMLLAPNASKAFIYFQF